jgi:membrane protease subunit HflK
MKLHSRFPRLALLPQGLRGMFNLNDPRWGRGDDGKDDSSNAGQEPSRPPYTPPEQNNRPSPQRPASGGAPDLDELWQDLNKKLGGLFGGGKGGGTGRGGAGQPPEFKGAGVGLGLIVGVAALIWLGTGFFIVQEGQQAVITQFGKYNKTVNAGINWRLPYPIQRHELVYVSQIRSADVGRDSIIKTTGLRESAMLTEDENIVEIKFAVQYRLSDARAWLFESKAPADTVIQVAETAVREVVGKMKMDATLAEERDQIAPRVRELMQVILDRYKIGVEVVGVNLQQGGVRPPEQVQAAFDDVLKAGQERERTKNQAEAYANDVVPRATGTASRLMEEAAAYKERIVAQAQGDAQRFSSIYTEYQKAPVVTRDRLYLETMQQVYSNVTKVVVDSKQGSNLMYLPLDKLMQQGQAGAAAGDASASSTAPTTSAPAPAPSVPDARARDTSRTRDRESR